MSNVLFLRSNVVKAMCIEALNESLENKPHLYIIYYKDKDYTAIVNYFF
jgi:hypothetical protein